MLDPVTSLAHNLHTSKGAYALLLGSGLSQAAELPTGWQIVLDLIRRIAKLEGEDAQTLQDPSAWYRQTKGLEPNYSQLLDELAGTPNERRAILHSYIDPSPQDLEEGRRIPTKAHRAIARLVEKGYVRVIITTNFDRLIENALRDVGVEPTVLASVDDIKGVPPLTHCRCIVLKLHGDYLDTRIRNVDSELANYEPELDRYLDRILDEFGVIVCGWSGTWDNALRAAISRCPTRRYTTYWASRNAPNETAQELIIKRAAQVIDIQDADKFFDQLTEKVEALEEVDRPHPMDLRVARAMLKRYLSEERHRIRLHDLVMDEVHAVRERLRAERFSAQRNWSEEEFRGRVSAYEGMTELLRGLLMTGSYWSPPHADHLWIQAVQLLAAERSKGGGTIVWIELTGYPATLALYAAGLGAVSSRNYRALAKLLSAQIGPSSEKKFAVALLPFALRVDREAWQKLPGLERRHTPLSDHLFSLFESQLSNQVDGERSAEDQFDEFELLAALQHLHLAAGPENPNPEQCWLPVGRFAWKLQHHSGRRITELFEESGRGRQQWAPLKGGLFGGSYERFEVVTRGFENYMQRVRGHFW